MPANFRFHYRIESDPASHDEYEYSVMVDHPGTPDDVIFDRLAKIVSHLQTLNLNRTTNP